MEDNKGYRKLLLPVLAITVLALIIAGLAVRNRWQPPGDPGTPQDPVQVTVCEVGPSLLNAPQYVAVRLNLFDRSAIRVKLTTVQDSQAALSLLKEGKAEILTGGPELAVQAFSRDSQLRIPVFAQLSNNSGLFLLERKEAADEDTSENDKSAKPFSWRDLKGKTITSYPRGTIPDMVLTRELKKQGLIPQKSLALLQNIPLPDLGAAFVSGSGHYILAREPLVSWLVAGQHAVVVTTVRGDSGKLPTLCAMASEGFLQEKPRAAQGYVNGIFKAQRWLASHTAQEITGLLKPDFDGYSYQTLMTAVYRYKNLNVWAAYPLPEEQSLKNLQQLMVQSVELQSAVPTGDLVETKFARAAAKQKASFPGKKD